MSRDQNQQARAKGVDYRELPVEPLPDLSWQRIERNLMAELARGGHAGQEQAQAAPAGVRRAARRRVVLFGAAAAGLVAAAAVALLFVSTRTGSGERATEGPGASATQAQAQAQAQAQNQDQDQPGRTPSRIVTAAAPSAVTLGDVSLDVAPRSAVLVDDGRDRGVLVVLERGRVHCQVAPRNGRPPVVVSAGDARVEVVGTEFAVARIGDTAKVDVYHGVVKVVQHGRVIRVPAGHSWSGIDGGGELAAGPRHPAHQHRSAPRHHLARAGDRRAAPETAAQPDETREQPAPSAAARYDRAARLEASDPAASLAIYRDLAASGGAWAANALYAEGRLELDLGHSDRAQALLRSYIGRYPHGPNAEDARALLDRIQQKRAP